MAIIEPGIKRWIRTAPQTLGKDFGFFTRDECEIKTLAEAQDYLRNGCLQYEDIWAHLKEVGVQVDKSHCDSMYDIPDRNPIKQDILALHEAQKTNDLVLLIVHCSPQDAQTHTLEEIDATFEADGYMEAFLEKIETMATEEFGLNTEALNDSVVMTGHPLDLQRMQQAVEAEHLTRIMTKEKYDAIKAQLEKERSKALALGESEIHDTPRSASPLVRLRLYCLCKIPHVHFLLHYLPNLPRLQRRKRQIHQNQLLQSRG